MGRPVEQPSPEACSQPLYGLARPAGMAPKCYAARVALTFLLQAGDAAGLLGEFHGGRAFFASFRLRHVSVREGKVLYVGISDAPAWWITQANTLAELRGWTQFIGLQIEYSLMERTVERELIPMAKALNLGVLGLVSLGERRFVREVSR